jgi:hypothetical protein
MSATCHPTDGPHGTLLIRLSRRDVGLINKPPELHGRYRACALVGSPLPGEHRILICSSEEAYPPITSRSFLASSSRR